MPKDPLEPKAESPFDAHEDAQQDGDAPEEVAEDATEDPGDSTQHSAEDGVSDDMATLAMNPGVMAAEAEQELPFALRNAVPGEINDAEVMLRLKAGELECFDYLLQKYRRPIIHFMYRMVHNHAIAEEMAQEVFLRVYRSRETYRAEARFSTWLYRIATNLAVNHARDTKHERSAQTIHLDEPDSDTGAMPDVADSTPTIESDLLRRERLNAIRQHVLALPERQKSAVLMHKYEGMDYKQIGEVLKLSESATKSLLFRAYQTLREKLKDLM